MAGSRIAWLAPCTPLRVGAIHVRPTQSLPNMNIQYLFPIPLLHIRTVLFLLRGQVAWVYRQRFLLGKGQRCCTSDYGYAARRDEGERFMHMLSLHASVSLKINSFTRNYKKGYILQ